MRLSCLLYTSVNKIGSLRSIKVIRDGKTVADLDIYDFIMEGRLKDDIRLQDGDVIPVSYTHLQWSFFELSDN